MVQAALADPNSPEAKFFFFTDHPHHYDTWWGLKEMPIIDHRSPELRRRFYDGPDSVVAKWLGRHALDAWRIDVANMTGIHGGINLRHEVATTIRRTMAQVTSESFLQAESNHDASRDLYGDGYHGTMNYAAFTRPLWQWLLPPQQRPYAHGKYPMLLNLPGTLIVSAMRELSGVTPWQATLHAMNLIGSHDTHRVASLLGDPRLVDVAFGMLAAYPGVPMIYAGDEIGLATRSGVPASPTSSEPTTAAGSHPGGGSRAPRDELGPLRELRGASALRVVGLHWLRTAADAMAVAPAQLPETVLVHVAPRTAALGFHRSGLANPGLAGSGSTFGPMARYDHSSRRWAGVRDVGKSLMKWLTFRILFGAKSLGPSKFESSFKQFKRSAGHYDGDITPTTVRSFNQ